MAGTLAHRGPDADGLWIDPEAGAALGHRRLSIFDLSAAGPQPMASANGRWIAVYNGELYNTAETEDLIAAVPSPIMGPDAVPTPGPNPLPSP
jgi:asparagine synthase (glutamine-hydrolysing)